MKVRVDPNLCNGTGLCEGICPEVFELGDDGIARPKADVVPPEYEDAAREAAENCPADAIDVEE